MVHLVASAPQRFNHRAGRMQLVRAAHGAEEFLEQALVRPGDLLHVGAFVLGRLIAHQQPHAQPVTGCGQRTGQRVHGAGAYGGEHGAFFARDPAQGGRGVDRLGFMAHRKDLDQARLRVYPQHLADIGGTMPEDTDIVAHPLHQQAQHNRLRQGYVRAWRQGARGNGCIEAARLRNRCSPFHPFFRQFLVVHCSFLPRGRLISKKCAKK